MNPTRRKFLKLIGGSAFGAVLFQACGVPEDELLVQSPIEMPEDLVTGLVNWYATACHECSTRGCGVVVRVIEGRAKKIEGNLDHPINRGKHSARCEAGLQALYHPDRINAPLVRVGDRGSGQWKEISWTDAVSRVSNELKKVKDKSRIVMANNPIGGHLGMVLEKFVSAMGAKHLSYEALERSNLSLAIKKVFGQDVMPDFDIENSGYILSFGADFLSTWVSPIKYARGYGTFRQGDRERGTFVQIDSRFSMTGANADEILFVKPGEEGLLALSMAQVIISEGLGNPGAVSALTGNGAVDMSVFAPETVAKRIGVDADRIRKLAKDFADPNHGPSMAIGGGSAAAQTNGLFNLVAIYSLNYLVGSVGKKGGIIFNPEPALKSVPVTPRISSFSDWEKFVSDMDDGQVEALLLRGIDPVYGIPANVGLTKAIDKLPLLVSFSGHMDDTTQMADLILPESHFLEDWGSDIPDPGPGYQVVGFQQPVVRPLFEDRGVHLGTKSFPDVLMAIAYVMEVDLGLSGDSFKDVIQAGALELFETRSGSVKADNFDGFWHGVLKRGGWWDTESKYTGDVVDPPQFPSEIKDPEFDGPDGSGSFYLTPFASASLTDGRGARLPWLQATPDPITTATWATWVEINMKTAEKLDIKEGDVVKIVAPNGEVDALAYPHPGIPPDVVAVPIGQGHKSGGRYAEGRGSNVLSILSPMSDSETGALAWAATRVQIVPTGRWSRLPKFENTKPELSVDEGHHVIKITPNDT